MSSCGCSQKGGGSRRCSCKKCRRYSQRGGDSTGWFGNLLGSSATSTATPSTSPPINPETKCIPLEEYNRLNKYAEQRSEQSGVVIQKGGKHRTRKTRRIKKSRKQMKSRKYRR
jgi:hypothetical protein